MSKMIVMNICPGETRAAVLEDNRLVDISLERRGGQKQVGNIYRGRVENVLPGMQAAFINIGMEKNAFLYVDDLNGIIPKADGVEIKKSLSISELLKEGQEIIVQMVKEPIGTKGARVVTHLTLAGRFLVFMPTMDYIGISRRIEDEKERERLKSIAQSIKPPEMGLIVRTAAEGMDVEDLKADVDLLHNIWRKIQKKSKKGPVPSLLYKEHDLLFRILRDIFTQEVDQLVIDDQGAFDKAVELLKGFAPELKSRVQLYQGDVPIFDAYNIEHQLNEALRRRVWLDNGSYIVFDQTEALTVIDVNTGKFIGENNLNETVVLTNLSAAKEIARQIRLRNLAGIIIIDFIDMENEEDRKQVVNTFQAELEKDKIKANILGFTSLGLLEVTRKKVRPSLQEQLQQVCQNCEGSGYSDSLETMALRLERRIMNLSARHDEEAMLYAVNPAMASLLIGPGGNHLAAMEEASHKRLYIKGQEGLDYSDLKLIKAGSQVDLERSALPVIEGQTCIVEVTESHMNNPNDGIGRIEGYVIDIEGAGEFVGKKVNVEITKAYRTYAKGKMIDEAGLNVVEG